MTDDAMALIVEAIFRGRLCAPCIARRTGLAVLRVDVILRNLVKSTVAVLQANDCDGCSQVTEVYRMGNAR